MTLSLEWRQYQHLAVGGEGGGRKGGREGGREGGMSENQYIHATQHIHGGDY